VAGFGITLKSPYTLNEKETMKNNILGRIGIFLILLLTIVSVSGCINDVQDTKTYILKDVHFDAFHKQFTIAATDIGWSIIYDGPDFDNNKRHLVIFDKNADGLGLGYSRQGFVTIAQQSQNLRISTGIQYNSGITAVNHQVLNEMRDLLEKTSKLLELDSSRIILIDGWQCKNKSVISDMGRSYPQVHRLAP
jgi:hypothetical protein